MFEVLKQPLATKGKHWQTVLIATFSVGLVLGLFQPFGIGAIKDGQKWIIIGSFMVVSGVFSAFATFVLPRLFPRFYDPSQWTWGKHTLQIAIILALVSIGNTLLACFFSEIPLLKALPVLVSFLVVTMMVGVVPVSLVTLIVHNNSLRHYLNEAKEMNSRLQDREIEQSETVAETGTETITLSGSTKESATFTPDRFLYAEASGNYVKVNYLTTSHTLTHLLLRTTITQVENKLESVAAIRRCHRAFLVNTAHIVNVQGNSQGFSLNLKHTKDEVPVSRSYTKEIREILSQKN